MQDSLLKDGERIDDLQRNGYRIIQNPQCFCFGIDAVLLSAFAFASDGEKVLDLGTGTGIVPILMSARYPGARFTGLEIQPKMAEMASRSVVMNGLPDKIEIVEGDIKKAAEIFGAAAFDVVTANPPYMNENHGLKNPSEPKAIARHEILCTLGDVLKASAACLKTGGKLFMVHRPHRLAEIIEKMKMYRLEPKVIRMVHPHEDEEAKMVLIQAVLGGGSWLKVEKPLIIYDSEGNYKKEIHDIYEG